MITVGSVGLDEDFLTTHAGSNTKSDGSRLERLEEMLIKNEVDLVAVGRALLADPEWGLKLRENRIGDARPFMREALATLA